MLLMRLLVAAAEDAVAPSMGLLLLLFCVGLMGCWPPAFQAFCALTLTGSGLPPEPPSPVGDVTGLARTLMVAASYSCP